MDLISIVLGAAAGGFVGFLVAHLTVRTTVGILTEQSAVAELELWIDDAANLAADVGRSWATRGEGMSEEDKVKAPELERSLRVSLARLRRHLPARFENALTHADDLVRFNQAAVGGRYRNALLEPDYSDAPPIPDIAGEDWRPVGEWIDNKHRAVASECSSYLEQGKKLRPKWWPDNKT